MAEEQMLQDEFIRCKDCGGEFIFSVGEQRFFAKKNLNRPVRCPDCRLKKREQRESGGGPGGGRRDRRRSTDED